MTQEHNYLWLKNFWETRIGSHPGRRWQVVSLTDGDLALRDGFAHGLVRQRLSHRDDVDYRYVRAWEADPDDSELGTNVDFFLIGRPRLFTSPRFALLASRLEAKAFGNFSDPPTLGRRGLFRYGNRNLMRHELEEPFGEYRRYDRDYGLLLYRCEYIGGEERILVAIAGIGVLGTLGLLTVLTDDRRRLELVQQVANLAPLTANHASEKHIEIGVRIEVEGHSGLVNLINNISKGELAFSFQTEVVAIETQDGKPDVYLYTGTEVDFQQLRLPAKRSELLHYIVNKEKTTPENLCRALKFVKGKNQPGDHEFRRLAKLVHDLNADLKKKGFTRDQNARLIRFDKRQGCYIFEGVHVVKRTN